MEPELFDGDVVIVDPKETSMKKGDIGVFRIYGDETIKIFMPLENKAGYILQPRNPSFKPMLITDESKCTAIGKVIYQIVKCK